MNKEELRINRDILKTVLSEKKQGLLDNIYIKSALPTITKWSFFFNYLLININNDLVGTSESYGVDISIKGGSYDLLSAQRWRRLFVQLD